MGGEIYTSAPGNRVVRWVCTYTAKKEKKEGKSRTEQFGGKKKINNEQKNRTTTKRRYLAAARLYVKTIRFPQNTIQTKKDETSAPPTMNMSIKKCVCGVGGSDVCVCVCRDSITLPSIFHTSSSTCPITATSPGRRRLIPQWRRTRIGASVCFPPQL